jgi:hypothetical protein
MTSRRSPTWQQPRFWQRFGSFGGVAKGALRPHSTCAQPEQLADS